MKKIYDFYMDPGHGWLKVKQSELNDLGISEKISECSYYRGEFVYLEEDCDMTLFINVLEEKGISVSFREHNSNRFSRIRSYKPYSSILTRIPYHGF